jgi:NAD(P)-dependent dehydrogenase (short-subunit alcohol dehydrogenase family)
MLKGVDMPVFSDWNPCVMQGAFLPADQTGSSGAANAAWRAAGEDGSDESGKRAAGNPGPDTGASAGRMGLDHGENSYRGRGRLAGRKALVIGADAGIGRAVAIAYAREGADVVVNFLPAGERAGSEVLAQIRAEGRRAVAIPGDVRDQAFCLELVQRAHEAMGGIDLLANAACAADVPDDGGMLRDDHIPFRAHLYAMFWLCRSVLPLMPPGASIINTAQIQPCNADTVVQDDSATQAAIVAFTRALVRQAAAREVRVNLVRPGPLRTLLQPDGGQPAQVAALYVLLASRDNNLLSGELYGVTGGLADGVAP